jgi:hypothetical protein
MLELIIRVYTDNTIYCGNDQPSVYHNTTSILININVLEMIIGV